jgi:hypothetical protein
MLLNQYTNKQRTEREYLKTMMPRGHSVGLNIVVTPDTATAVPESYLSLSACCVETNLQLSTALGLSPISGLFPLFDGYDHALFKTTH